MDYYRLLNVARNATAKELKTSFRKLALTLHPDVNGGDDKKTAQFNRVLDAYNTLSDQSSRNDYDAAHPVNPAASARAGNPARSYSSTSTVYAKPHFVHTSVHQQYASDKTQDHNTHSGYDPYHQVDPPPGMNETAWYTTHYGAQTAADMASKKHKPIILDGGSEWQYNNDPLFDRNNAHSEYYRKKAVKEHFRGQANYVSHDPTETPDEIARMRARQRVKDAHIPPASVRSTAESVSHKLQQQRQKRRDVRHAKDVFDSEEGAAHIDSSSKDHIRASYSRKQHAGSTSAANGSSKEGCLVS